MLKAGCVKALGAMSGTSLDGVDVAVVETDGERIFGFGATGYRPYDAQEREVLRTALGKWPGDDLEQARAVVEDAHVEALSLIEGAEIVGFHGQTLAHDPRGRGTHQLGDGAVLAQRLGLPVIWDFRSTDIRLGGEGAPLAPFFHHACAHYIGATEPLAFLNLGGVGNLTWIDPRFSRPEEPGALLAFDTGPANAPINDLVQKRLGMDCDHNGALARSGRVENGALELFLDDPWFYRMPPKSLDRDAFSDMIGLVCELTDADAAATLTAMAAAAVFRGIEHCPVPPARVLVTGGGAEQPGHDANASRGAGLHGSARRTCWSGWRYARSTSFCISCRTRGARVAHILRRNDRSACGCRRWGNQPAEIGPLGAARLVRAYGNPLRSKRGMLQSEARKVDYLVRIQG